MARRTPGSIRETPNMRTPREEFLGIPRDFPFPPRVVNSRISPAGALRTKSDRQRNIHGSPQPPDRSHTSAVAGRE